MPYFGSTLFVVALLLGSTALLVGGIHLVTALARERVVRAADITRERPFASVLVGLPVCAAIILAIAVLGNLGPFGKALAFLWGSLAGGLALMALAVATARVGRGLLPKEDPGSMTATHRGAIVLLFSSIIPFFGWFLVLPLSLLGGVGALAHTLVARRSPSAEAAPSFASTRIS